MPFTLWSRSQLLGDTDFELANSGAKRAGVFRPTTIGTALLPTLTGIGPALLALGERYRREGLTAKDAEAAMTMFAQSEVVSFARQLDALHLELRDPNGRPMSTDSLAVHDLERTVAAFGATAQPADGESRPRYLISATLRIRRRKMAMVAVNV